MKEDKNDLQQKNFLYLVPSGSDSESAKVDFVKLFKQIWAGKWIILTVSFVFTLLSGYYAFSQPNYYKSVAFLSPAGVASGADSSLAGGLGGLASLAGIRLGGGGKNKAELALAILKSKRFIVSFAKKEAIVVPLIAGERWDPLSETLILNEKVYDASSNHWLPAAMQPGRDAPSDNLIYQKLFSRLTVAEDKRSGYVTISLQYYSPVLAKEWLEKLVSALNAEMKNKDIDDAQKNIEFLEAQAQRTDVIEVKRVIFDLIESEIRTAMLANAREDYIYEYIDPPTVPEMKSGPDRKLMVILGFMAGIIFGTIIVLISGLFKRKAVNLQSNS
ncbi:LPS O-antigen length regulator [Hahella sp. KA22]|uniref:Wzz/FepE/Etk N-terminal domain-containing protein n=1 Tax=Hahella sp. KA22 TaxID=1628392 RepID=UPI000FDDD15C|nr:Wzz/FepE/Etk N-terminal domain-containing protein [Hahella sp. KA22]AZZ91661.1 LPS O-antigen length regulator [Hahella sp. KA22]QAY55031.1 LPS O-antigen length regulator [Hahella sp. KA22]